MDLAAQRLNALLDQFFPALNETIAEMEANGADVIRLDMGSPDLPPPAGALQALLETAALPDSHGYQPNRGLPALRRAWSTMYARDYGIELDPNRQVLPLLGSKEGIFHLALAVLNPGDVALVPDPGYLTYRQGALSAGAQPYPLPLKAENHYLPDFEAVPEAVLCRTRLLWLNYPHNPTCAVAPLEFFRHALDFARRHQILLCHDASYLRVSFDGYQSPSLMQVPGASQLAVEFNSLSKTYNMAGWRLGAAVGCPEALQALYTIKGAADSSHFGPIMQAACIAMLGDQSCISERNLVYERRRDRVLAALQRLGWQAETPKAGLYIWFHIPPGWTSAQFTRHVLQHAHVSLAPGSIFGAQGEGYTRLAFTCPEARLDEALKRLEEDYQKYEPALNDRR